MYLDKEVEMGILIENDVLDKVFVFFLGLKIVWWIFKVVMCL